MVIEQLWICVLSWLFQQWFSMGWLIQTDEKCYSHHWSSLENIVDDICIANIIGSLTFRSKRQFNQMNTLYRMRFNQNNDRICCTDNTSKILQNETCLVSGYNGTQITQNCDYQTNTYVKSLFT